MPREPLVSICMPSFNHARYLPFAIESALAQTYRNIELVIVDDGSTDGSLNIAERYASRDPDRVRVFTHARHASRGISATANRAFRESRGAYWCGLCSDDVFVRDKVERQVTFLQQHPEIGMVYGEVATIDEGGRKVGRLAARDLSSDRWPFARLLEENYIYGQAAMVRRACLEAVGLHDEQLIYSDWELWIRILARYNVAFLPGTVTYYRVHARNTSLGQSPRIQLDRHLQVMRAIELKAPAIDHALGQRFNGGVLQLQLAYLYFCAGNERAATRALEAAVGVAPELLRNTGFLAGWLFRRQAQTAWFGGAPAMDFIAWFAEQALPLVPGATDPSAVSTRRRLRYTVLLARLAARAWQRGRSLRDSVKLCARPRREVG